MPNPIQQFLHNFRRTQSIANAKIGAITWGPVLLVILGFITSIEAIYYFSNFTRQRLFLLVLVSFFVVLSYLFLRWMIHFKGWLQNSNDAELAKICGEKDPKIADRLLNAHQLESVSENERGADLAQKAIAKIGQQLSKIDIQSLVDTASKSFKQTAIYVSIITLIVFLGFGKFTFPAFNRIIHHNTDFPVPLPFTLTSISGNQQILGGDTVSVAIAGIGDLPDSLHIYWESKNGVQQTISHNNGEVYRHRFNSIRTDIEVWAEVKSNSWFSAWDKITSKKDTIFVTDRPVVKDVQFTIIPPQYTGEDTKIIKGVNSDISLLKGSRLQIKATSTKPLDLAWLVSDSTRINLNTKGHEITGTFGVNEDLTMAIYCIDENSVANLHPPHYRVSTIQDYPPDLIIQSPKQDFELDESNTIELSAQTSDDFGFSRTWLDYTIIAPDYIQQDSTIFSQEIPDILTNVRSQQILYFWDIDNLRLAIGDEIHFWVNIADNNTLSGPSVTQSSEFIGRFPSLEDLFERMETHEDEIDEYTEEIEMSIEDVQELVEELELDLLKSDEMDWEQQQKVEETVEKMEEIFNQVEQIQNAMEQLQEQAEKNNLVDDQLMEKFDKFQELMDQMMTPELMEALEKMQEAMSEMDPQKMLDALQNFEYDLSEFEEQLDRFIEMFEMAMAEQKMDELVKQMEEMVNEQNQIMEEMKSEEDLSNLASRERRQEERFKHVEDLMDDASEAIEDISEQASEQLEQLAESELTKETAEKLEQTRKEMQKNNQQGAEQSGQQSSENLQEMLEKMQEAQEQFQNQAIEEMMNEFMAVIVNILSISEKQESLIAFSKGLRSSSPRLAETATRQHDIKRSADQLLKQILILSRKTFYITPPINRALGKTQLAMNKSISNLEQKRVGTARSEQKKVLSGFNETAYLLLSAMSEMQSSQSASGFEQYMEALSEMSEQQQGINQGTMQLGQMGMMAQQQMMEQLQQQQEGLQEKLEELLGDMPGEETGGMAQANEEMEDVIEDFRRKQITRETIERQERILSRMLDSQKSMKQRDFSEKRKSHTGEEFEYVGPTGLPENMGDRNLLYIKAMESALQEGHSREYQEMMKTYFRDLQKQSETNE